jgi:hypothetical protein
MDKAKKQSAIKKKFKTNWSKRLNIQIIGVLKKKKNIENENK